VPALSVPEPEKKTCMNCGAQINSQSPICPICGSGDPFVPRLSLQRKQEATRWWLYGLLGFLGLRLLGGAYQIINESFVAGVLTLLVHGLSFYGVFREKKWGYYLTSFWAGLDVVLALLLAYGANGLSSLISYFGAMVVDVLLLGLAIYGYIKVFRQIKEPQSPPPPFT
jgi:hypothetical protein